jgi:4-amino-4-deoxy-L-arabinose transferase-like glycosyltransferase
MDAEMTQGRDALQEGFHDDVARGAASRASAAGVLSAYSWWAAVGVLVAAYVAVHLATVTSSRLPWFDDTFFASISDSVRRTGRFTLEVSPLWIDGPVYLYGPVYFVTLGGVFDLFGFGLMQTRLPGLVCGFGILGVAYLILRRAGVRAVIAAGACALLGLDPTFHQSIHSGRTDSLAMFLLLASFATLQISGRRSAWWSASSGLLAALGVLTTPRPGYLAIPMGLILVWRWARHPSRERALQAVVWGSVSLACLAAWVAWAFGGIPAMLAYFGKFSETYAGGGLGVRAIHAPVLLPVAALLSALVVARPRALQRELVFFCLAGIAGFYLFVKDKGSFSGLYAFFMIPLAYLLVGYGLSRLADALPRNRGARLLRYGAVALLLAFNGGVFVARSLLELLQHDSREPSSAAAVIDRLIPPGSRVVGDDKYYFLARQAGSDFQYLQRGAGSEEERARFHAGPYGADFVVTAEPDTSSLLQAYKREMRLVPVGTIVSPPDGAMARMISDLARWAGIGSSLTASYEGRVFARKEADHDR